MEGHEKTSLRAYAGSGELKHEAQCECGFRTEKSVEFDAVLAALKKHRDEQGVS